MTKEYKGKRKCTFVTETSIKMLEVVEAYIASHPHCTVYDLVGHLKLSEHTLRGYMTELHNRGVISHDVVQRKPAGGFMPRTWMIGSKGVQSTNVLQEVKQTVTKDWIRAEVNPDSMALPMDFFRGCSK